jgi:hypothetical protein
MQGLKSRIPNGMPVAFFPKAEALTPGFVRIVGHVEQVHLRNRLKGELTGDVAKIRSCSLGGSLTGIDGVAGRKTKNTATKNLITALGKVSISPFLALKLMRNDLYGSDSIEVGNQTTT